MKRSTPLYKKKPLQNIPESEVTSAERSAEDPIPITPIDEENTEQLFRHLNSPKLDATEQAKEAQPIIDEAKERDSKFSTTFGFSHGVENMNLVKKSPFPSTKPGSIKRKEDAKKDMSICFELASKASTITQKITDSYQMMPQFDLAQAAIFDTSPPASPMDIENSQMYTAGATPADLAEQLNIMEELGKTCLDSPINIMKNDDSNTVLATTVSKGKNKKNNHHQDT